MLVWKKPIVGPACRLAIAGDFLPASGLQLPHGRTWKDVAMGLSRRFAKADVSILNLECCVNVGDAAAKTKMGSGDSFSAVSEVLDFPASLGTKILGLANNHICDFGEQGVARTKQALVDRDLIALGIGRTLAEPPDTQVVETPSGVRVGIWAAARHLPELATLKKAGIEPATRSRAEAAFKNLKDQGADWTLAFLHAGLERTNRPDPDDVALMDEFARMGFDLVTACHSHRISGYKRIDRKTGGPAFCFYGLGSICSGVLYSELEREGLIIDVAFSKSAGISQVDVYPVYLEGSGWGRIPFFANAYATLTRFEELAKEIQSGSYKQKFYHDLKNGLFYSYSRDIQTALQNGGVRGLATKLGRIRMRHLNRVLQSGIS